MGLFQGRFASIVARSVTAAAVSLVVLGAATSAQASVIFDFVGIVAANGEGPFDNSAAYTIEGGIKIQATSFGFVGSQAYLDGVSGGLPAGLGACHGFTADVPPQCTPSSEDNVTSGETLTLSFFDAVTMNPLPVVLDPTFFRDANHNGFFSLGDMIDITDAGGLMTRQLPLLGEFTTPLTGTTFDFTYNDTEFYIGSVTVTAVPLPAALPLFLSALAGLAFVGRRRGRQSAA